MSRAILPTSSLSSVKKIIPFGQNSPESPQRQITQSDQDYFTFRDSLEEPQSDPKPKPLTPILKKRPNDSKSTGEKMNRERILGEICLYSDDFSRFCARRDSS